MRTNREEWYILYCRWNEVMLSTAVHWFPSTEEEGEPVSQIILALCQPVSQLVVASYPGTLLRGMPQHIQGTWVSSIHDQQLNLHRLASMGSNVQGCGVTVLCRGRGGGGEDEGGGEGDHSGSVTNQPGACS